MDTFRYRSLIEGVRPWVRKTKSSQPKSKLEVWLPHLSSLSQVGLLVVTIATIFFTVIPLYQKAVLEELVAQKQVELKAIQHTVDTLYADVRSYTIFQFAHIAGIQCSTLLRPVGVKGGTEWWQILPEKCLDDVLSRSSVADRLRADDYKRFAREVARVGKELEQRRVAAYEEYLNLPARAKTDSSLLRGDTGSFLERLIKALPMSAEDELDMRRKMALDSGRLALETSYTAFVTSKIQGLNSIEWPQL